MVVSGFVLFGIKECRHTVRQAGCAERKIGQGVFEYSVIVPRSILAFVEINERHQVERRDAIRVGLELEAVRVETELQARGLAGGAPGVEIGRPSETYRRVRIESKFGKLTALVTDGHLPYPYGREMTGYEVTNLADTVAKAKAAGADVLVPLYKTGERDAVIVRFPGGYIAEIHSAVKK